MERQWIKHNLKIPQERDNQPIGPYTRSRRDCGKANWIRRHSRNSRHRKIAKNASNSDGWKGANKKYKTRISDPVKLALPKFTGRCTGLSGFINESGPNQADEYIKTTL